EILTTFPSYTYGEDESPPSRSSVCSICLSEYQNGDSLRLLPNCGHVFHKGCIDLWLSTRSSSCPICRDQAVAVTNPSSDEDGGGVAGSGGSLIPPWNINFGTGTGHVL
ncbi:RING-H2 finger protein ATL8, partial [Linum grandiflorum]